eukprot:GFUD01004134.1.p1 GENE.GFUD01004134.1~~GFUD01004134.1.p1  ORF type:complete len:152 (+),score=29.96 GFUD01004134.1:130-585(+)
MEIIRVTPENYDQHLDLMETTRSYRQVHLWPIETDTSLVEVYRESDRSKTTLVAVTSSEEFMGMAQWDPELGRLRQVIVAEAYRGHGVGSQLVRRVLREAGHAGRANVLVHSLQQAIQFYSTLGFTETGSPYASGDKKVTCQKMLACSSLT